MSNTSHHVNDYEVGQRVRVSDGMQEPPARFNRKHEEWEHNNYSGAVMELEEPRDYTPNGSVILSRDGYPDGMGGVAQFRFQVPIGGRLTVTAEQS